MASSMLFKYSGRNSFNVEVPEKIRLRPFAERPEHAPYPCRIYDSKGILKYELSTEHLTDRLFKRSYGRFIKSNRKATNV